jgi:hypothetical protein
MDYAQDLLKRPVRATNSHENAELFAYGREQYSYIMDYYTNPAQRAPGSIISKSWTIDQSSDFWITNIVFSVSSDSSPAYDTIAVGQLTVHDGVTRYDLVKDLWVGAFMQTNFQQSNNYAQRCILPQPYGLGAGGNFSVTIVVPPTNRIDSKYCQVYIEGFKDYRIGGIRG